MSFIFGTDYISDTDEVRRLARNTVNADFDNPQIISYQVKEYSNIRTITHKDNWLPSDREFYAIQLQETRLAAADVIDHYGIGTPQQIAASKSLRDAFQMDMYGNGQSNSGILSGILANLSSESQSAELDEGIDLSVQESGSYPSSLSDSPPSVKIHRSTNVII